MGPITPPKGGHQMWTSKAELVAAHEAGESDGSYNFPSQMEPCFSCTQMVINHSSLQQPTAHLGTLSLPPAEMQ